jgi:hypothetical protein
MLAARFLRALAVGVLPVAGHGNQPYIFCLWLLTQMSRDLVAVHIRQANIQQHDVRLILNCRFQSGLTGVSRLNLMPEHLQHHDQHISRIHVVINYQHPRCLRGLFRCFNGGDWISCRRQCRQTHKELASLPQSRTVSLDCSTMQFHKFLHKAQADAQATLRAIKRSIRLREEIETSDDDFAWGSCMFP